MEVTELMVSMSRLLREKLRASRDKSKEYWRKVRDAGKAV